MVMFMESTMSLWNLYLVQRMESTMFTFVLAVLSSDSSVGKVLVSRFVSMVTCVWLGRVYSQKEIYDFEDRKSVV